MSRSYLLVLSEATALAWVLTEQRMAFPARRRSKAMALEIGDELIIYTTRGCFHNPRRDRGRAMGLALVKSSLHDLPKPVVLGERRFTSGCDLSIEGLAAVHHGVELHPLVPELHAFPDPTGWAAWLRRPLLPLDAHDADRLKSELIPLLEPYSRHMESYVGVATRLADTSVQHRRDWLRFVLPSHASSEE